MYIIYQYIQLIHIRINHYTSLRHILQFKSYGSPPEAGKLGNPWHLPILKVLRHKGHNIRFKSFKNRWFLYFVILIGQKFINTIQMPVHISNIYIYALCYIWRETSVECLMHLCSCCTACFVVSSVLFVFDAFANKCECQWETYIYLDSLRTIAYTLRMMDTLLLETQGTQTEQETLQLTKITVDMSKRTNWRRVLLERQIKLPALVCINIHHLWCSIASIMARAHAS